MMTHALKGGCYCGSLTVEIMLTQAPEELSPRACTCAFCTRNGASYLSDPEGRLAFTCHDPSALGRYRQELDGAAEFLFCRTCAVLVGVIHAEDGQVYGAVNARVVEAPFALAAPVSPHMLPKAERLDRWKALWFRDVKLREDG